MYKEILENLEKNINDLYGLVDKNADGAVEFEEKICRCKNKMVKLCRALPVLTAEKRNEARIKERALLVAHQKKLAIEILKSKGE